MANTNNLVSITGYAQRVFDNGNLVAFTIAAFASKNKETGKSKYDYIPCILFPNSASTLNKAMKAAGGWETLDGKSVSITGKLIHGKAYNKQVDAEIYKTDVVVDTLSISVIQSSQSGTYAATTPTQPAGQALPDMNDELPF